jgi:hypothetical protein
MNFANGGRAWPTLDSSNFALIGTNVFSRDDKTQEYEGQNHSRTLLRVGKELVFSKSLKYFSQMVEMIGFVWIVDENIIEVNHHKIVDKNGGVPDS